MIGEFVTKSNNLLQGRTIRRPLFILAGFVSLFIFLKITFFSRASVPILIDPSTEAGTGTETETWQGPLKTFVVSSQQKDNISWIGENLSGWEVTRYVVDDSNAEFTVPKNKGREAMVYLT